MARTPRERSANDGLEAAIEEYREAFREANPEATHGTMTDWIIVAAETKPEVDPEDDITAYTIIMPGGGIPWYRARGLLQAGIHYLEGPGNEGD